MPESSMIPPKHHGSGAFIGAAVLMLLAMGGLLYWKFGGKEEPPPAAPPVVSANTEPVFDEPPPPPPPPEEVTPDAGKVEKKPTIKRVAATSGGGCGGTCKGSAPSALQGALGGAAGQARGCYERALRQNPLLQGRVVVAVRVAANGSVCSASLASDSLGDPGVSSCVLQKFRGGRFPSPSDGCVDVHVPISFMPKTAK